MINTLYLNKFVAICEREQPPPQPSIVNIRLRIEKIKQFPQTKLNKYNYCEFHEIIQSVIHFNEMVLLKPLISTEKKETHIVPSLIDDAYFTREYNAVYISRENMLIHSILLMIDNTYYELDSGREKYVDDFIKKNKLITDTSYIIENFIHSVSATLFVNIIILKVDGEINIFNTHHQNTIVLILIENEYFPIENAIERVYNSNNPFVKHFMNHPLAIYIKNNPINHNLPAFEEMDSDPTSTKDIYVSEVVAPIKQIKHTAPKIKKTNKDVFISNTPIKEENETTESSIFVQTEMITKEDIEIVKGTANAKLSLPELQALATRVGIELAKGSTAKGTPKLKTKKDLLDEIMAL